LRGANLSRANLEGAALDGADLTDVNLTEANLCRTDLSRVNFSGAKGLSSEMLQDACAGPSRPPNAFDVEGQNLFDDDAQPLGLKGSGPVRRCGQYRCLSEISFKTGNRTPASAKEILQSAIEKLWNNRYADAASILSVTLAWGVFYLVGRFAKSQLSVALDGSSIRFPARFPERSLAYSRDFLATFVRDHPATAQFYREPILFPCDVIVMALLSITMAGASWHWLEASGCSWPMLAFILPLLYFSADYAEDLQLAKLLGGPDAVTDDAVTALKRLTALKLAAIAAVVIQTLATLSVYGWFLVFGVR
jgi:hypothetical protein